MSFESSGYSDPSTSTHRAVTPESETSADELALDHVTVTPRSVPANALREGNLREMIVYTKLNTT
jgi:hypothetical protein